MALNKLHKQRAQEINQQAHLQRSKVGSVVFPGDTMTAKQATGFDGKTRIGIGLTPSVIRRNDESTSEAILVTRAGVLKSRYDKPPKLWVTSRQRRYIPYAEDRVIGIITRVNSFFYEVEIKGPSLGLLGTLEFEGATKRNRPDLKVGDIVFCRVSVSNRDMQPILSCKSPSFNKSWVSGEALFVELKGGFMFDCSLNWAHRLNRIKSPHLKYLSTFFPFEVAIGVNGRMWIKACHIKHTLMLANILKNGEYCNMRQFEVMTQTLLKKYGIQNIQ